MNIPNAFRKLFDHPKIYSNVVRYVHEDGRDLPLDGTVLAHLECGHSIRITQHRRRSLPCPVCLDQVAK